jgi:hypothetical protein
MNQTLFMTRDRESIARVTRVSRTYENDTRGPTSLLNLHIYCSKLEPYTICMLHFRSQNIVAALLITRVLKWSTLSQGGERIGRTLVDVELRT